jgi:hypothetical protein
LRDLLVKLSGLCLVTRIIGFAIYFFGFGQTFEGESRISAENDEPGKIGLVTFHSRFMNRRFLTHSMCLDLLPDTPTTYQGEVIDAREAVKKFADTEINARPGYREKRSGWGYVISLDLEPPGTSPKEILLIVSLILIVGSTASMALIARSD